MLTIIHSSRWIAKNGEGVGTFITSGCEVNKGGGAVSQYKCTKFESKFLQHVLFLQLNPSPLYIHLTSLLKWWMLPGLPCFSLLFALMCYCEHMFIQVYCVKYGVFTFSMGIKSSTLWQQKKNGSDTSYLYCRGLFCQNLPPTLAPFGPMLISMEPTPGTFDHLNVNSCSRRCVMCGGQGPCLYSRGQFFWSVNMNLDRTTNGGSGDRVSSWLSFCCERRLKYWREDFCCDGVITWMLKMDQWIVWG